MTMKRRLYRGRDVRRAQNIAELRAMAAARCPTSALNTWRAARTMN